jgi:hypothetical protein
MNVLANAALATFVESFSVFGPASRGDLQPGPETDLSASPLLWLRRRRSLEKTLPMMRVWSFSLRAGSPRVVCASHSNFGSEDEILSPG